MSASPAATELIKRSEAPGGRPILKAYKRAGDVWTIGYGNTKKVHSGDTITPEQADERLRQDMSVAEKTVRSQVKVQLTQGQFDALTSFVFNKKGGSLEGTTLLKKLNAGDYAGAQKEFSKWDHAKDGTGKKVELKGLEKRRTAEAALFGNQGPQAAPEK